MNKLQQSQQFLILNPADDLQTIPQLENWHENIDQDNANKVVPLPMNQKKTVNVIATILKKMTQVHISLTVIYIVDSNQRQEFIIKYTKMIIDRYFYHIPVGQQPCLTTSYQVRNQSQIVFTTFKEFIQKDLFLNNMYYAMFVQTSNFVRAVRDSFGDYITDTYLRRSYIEALRLQECYRAEEKQIKNINLPSKKKGQPKIITLHSKNSQIEKQQQEQPIKYEHPQFGNEPAKKISTTFYDKRDSLLNQRQKKQNVRFFQENELVLISGLIYIIGFLYNQLQIKKSRNFSEFIEDFQNKTSLNKSYLENIYKYFTQIYENCPNNIYQHRQDMYLHALCSFIHKVIRYSQLFPDDYEDLFEIIKPQKLLVDRRQSMIEESTSCLVINCKENNKICLKVLKKKSIRCYILQSLPCPDEYWHYIFKKKNILVNPQNQHYPNLYGLHISKTPSNEDINFAEKMSEGIETIKLKACGVLLHDLSKFIPDGIVVYFHSLEGLESFTREMDIDQEAIIKKIDHHKKIFYESAFEEQNRANFLKFKKCCYIGRGAIFFMVANGKTAQYLKFYKHLSRCIVFFGLPRRQNQHRKQLQLPENQPPEQKHLLQLHHINMEKISIINECINNCINDPSDYKSIIFVGGEITSDLGTWYKSFIRSWDETTRESLTKLRAFYQKMGRKGIF